MAQQVISELYAGNSWLTVYEAFTQVNFNSYDFNSIRQAMKDYITTNYPEKYNDWAENSEFVILIDLLAYFGQTMAFRMDLNTRENFLFTAERRESILRLARFLSYSPQRNYTATGLVKLTTLSINEDIYDSSGNNLNGITITWNDPTNDSWYEQWFTVLNQTLISTNPFGTPLLEYTDSSNVTYEQYRFDNVSITGGAIAFTSSVDNTSYDFNLCNLTIDETYGVQEDTPDTSESMNIVYINDGNGYDSANMGFFMLLKQGSIQNQTFSITDNIENRKIYVNVPDINQTDVWLQSLNSDGTIDTDWTKIDYSVNSNPSEYIGTQNITYNAIDQDIKTVYQVVTEPNDQIMLRFGDGNFGKIPYGTFRIWYRTSSNDGLVIKTSDMQNIQNNISYYSTNNTTKTLTFSFSATNIIDNATVSETDDQIKEKAPNFYSAQGRMVSGNDYNVLPNNINIAKKTSAVNRIYSGQSRYLDLNDPTGEYQNTDIIADDGILYKQYFSNYSEVSNNTTNISETLTGDTLKEIILDDTLRNFLYDKWLNYTNFSDTTKEITWVNSTSTQYDLTGYFDVSGTPVQAGSTANTNIVQYITAGTLLKFTNAGWVGVISVSDTIETLNLNGEGQVTLNSTVDTGDILEQVLPYYTTAFSTSETTLIENQITLNKTFGIGYDYVNLEWYVITNNTINLTGDYDFTTKGTSLDSSWLIILEYSPSAWRITNRGLNYIFESNSSKFFMDTGSKVIDLNTGLTKQDYISLLKYNGYTSNIDIDISNRYVTNSGYYDPSKVIVDFNYVLEMVSDPDVFSSVIGSNLVFHVLTTNTNGYQTYNLVTGVNVVTSSSDVPSTLGSTDIYYISGSPDLTEGTFVVGSSLTAANYVCNYGISSLYYLWKHYAPTNNRIDPAITNIIDIFVLTNGFYNQLTQWRENGLLSSSVPVVPTEEQLQTDFSSLEDIKMFTDEIIWRPVNVKYLFGQYASQNLKCTFKVVPTTINTLSNGEIGAQVLQLIYDYFDVDNWSFGDTFYFTKLSNYVMSNMTNIISAFYIVPVNEDQYYGDLQEIQSNTNEIFFPTTLISDIQIINSGNKTNLRIS